MKNLIFVAVVMATKLVDAGEHVPVPIILDTDIASDVDDVGAVAILHAMANHGEAKILAMGVCVKNPWTPLCLDALNTYFQRPEIPLGVVKGPAFKERSAYARQIAQEYPHALKRAEDAPDAAALYRQGPPGQAARTGVVVGMC